MPYHRPVLLTPVLDFLSPQPGQIFLDATLGHAGHSVPLLKSGAAVYGLDADPQNLQIATKRIKNLSLSKNFHPILGNFSDLKKIWKSTIGIPLDGLIADLGLSVNQQSQTYRGFSFNDTSSLDMRLNPDSQKLTAEAIINTWDRDQLYQLFTQTAQEKLARPLVYEIIKSRQLSPIKSGQRLAQIITDYYQQKHYRFSRHPATKIFLALRIAVNAEFDSLKNLLLAIPQITKPSARVALISFHSGEDRLIKNFLRRHHLKSSKTLPTRFEISSNPLARSAILRTYLPHEPQ